MTVNQLVQTIFKQVDDHDSDRSIKSVWRQNTLTNAFYREVCTVEVETLSGEREIFYNPLSEKHRFNEIKRWRRTPFATPSRLIDFTQGEATFTRATTPRF